MYKSYSDTDVIPMGEKQLNQYSSGDYVGFFCPKCYNPIIKKYTLNEEYFYDPEFIVTRKFELTCPECGNKFEQDWYLDPNITEVVALLNKKGYITEFCCEGHYTKDKDGYEYLSSTLYIYIYYSHSVRILYLMNSIYHIHGLKTPKVLIIFQHINMIDYAYAVILKLMMLVNNLLWM